ncbi:pilus assembly protein PilP [Exilibacterium tricleocarpae]|uniref:Pilus assembly protein PilP n=1 Tax=Exilibacterium tricleocarpae TaxID=2591008 RepID=A0A545SND2_9GAMM|nr:type IV pili methyl-accepting chemotaxis transducer N-terminal domain-containing protein [Exilibacterium tricleocarpae]TQV66488.1 pilus assembly protein PilP [Exilibacterium tricleocarpae]
MITRLLTLLLSAALGLAAAGAARVQDPAITMGDAINIAGRQRMLSQRIAQSYLLMGLQPQSGRGAKVLNRSINEFDRNHAALQQFAPGAAVRGELDAVEQLWLPYKTLALGEVSKESAALLIERSDTLLAAAHAYVGKLQVLSGTTKAELINVAGRQRMLSQRIAKNFLASHWGINVDTSKSALAADLAEYGTMLDYLYESPVNTEQIRSRLDRVKGQLRYAVKGFDGVMSLSSKRLVQVVTGTTDAMLRGMNEVTGLYAQLLK